MLSTFKKTAIAAIAALAFAVSAAPASADYYGDGYYGGFHRHHFFRHHAFFGLRARAFAPDCAVRRVVRFNRFGERVVVIRRICY